jgi:hypothetical protein
VKWPVGAGNAEKLWIFGDKRGGERKSERAAIGGGPHLSVAGHGGEADLLLDVLERVRQVRLRGSGVCRDAGAHSPVIE